MSSTRPGDASGWAVLGPGAIARELVAQLPAAAGTGNAAALDRWRAAIGLR